MKEPFCEKASPKTILELVALYDAWKRVFRAGAHGDNESYNLARDSRKAIEEEKWIPVKDLVSKLQKHKLQTKADWEEENSKGWGRDKEQMAFYRGQNNVYKEFLEALGE